MAKATNFEAWYEARNRGEQPPIALAFVEPTPTLANAQIATVDAGQVADGEPPRLTAAHRLEALGACVDAAADAASQLDGSLFSLLQEMLALRGELRLAKDPAAAEAHKLAEGVRDVYRSCRQLSKGICGIQSAAWKLQRQREERQEKSLVEWATGAPIAGGDCAPEAADLATADADGAPDPEAVEIAAGGGGGVSDVLQRPDVQA